MTDQKRLGQLAEIASLLSDRKLEELRRQRELRAGIVARIAALEERPAEGLDPLAAARAALAYQAWADGRRSELGRQLAAQESRCEESRMAAQTAFGRATILDRLSRR